MEDRSPEPGGPAAGATRAPSVPAAVDRATFQAELDELRVREKAHTREGDAIAAARRRLPVVEVDGSNTRIDGRPIAQWSRLEAGRSDDLTVGP